MVLATKTRTGVEVMRSERADIESKGAG